jgi:predicted hydrocarbon binding protein
MPLKDKLPNQLFNLAFITVEEVLGKNGLNSVLRYAKIPHYIDNYPPRNLDLEHPSADFGSLIAGMVQVIGEKGARSVLTLSGIRSFEIMQREMPALFALDGVEVKDGPVAKLFEEYVRIYTAISQAASYVFGDGLYNYYDVDEGWAFEISPCYWCTGLKTKTAICYGEVGFELGAARWVFGKDIKIEETHCIAKGDPKCRFLIHRPEE